MEFNKLTEEEIYIIKQKGTERSFTGKYDKHTKVSIETGIFAAGCFWGVEYYFQKVHGVLSTKVGYTGGKKLNPSYKEVSRGDTGHVEAIEVSFDPSIVSYESLTKLFFEIHDFSQVDGQGPDIGEQYRSEIFYKNDIQKQSATQLIDSLKKKGHKVVTRLTQANEFWEAEQYHQKYYEKNGQIPYCHIRKKIFDKDYQE